jgi:hypothetical protein
MSSQYANLSVPSVAGSAQKVTTSTTSAQSTALQAGEWIALASAVTFVLRGANPTAVVDTCPALPANIPVRLKGIQDNDKLAFIVASGTGTVYLSRDQ